MVYRLKLLHCPNTFGLNCITVHPDLHLSGSDSLWLTGRDGEQGPADTENLPQDGCHTPGTCPGTTGWNVLIDSWSVTSDYYTTVPVTPRAMSQELFEEFSSNLTQMFQGWTDYILEVKSKSHFIYYRCYLNFNLHLYSCFFIYLLLDLKSVGQVIIHLKL